MAERWKGSSTHGQMLEEAAATAIFVSRCESRFSKDAFVFELGLWGGVV